MKSCPTCNRTYSDDSFSFCLADGTLLSAPYNSNETQVLPAHYPKNQPPTEVIQPDSTISKRRILEFIGNDEEYLKWLENNPNGFVINTRKEMNPNYMVLHKATCGTVKSTKGIPKGGFTERAYIKVCSAVRTELQQWAISHGRLDGSFSNECDACRPSGRSITNKTREEENSESALWIDEPVISININQQYPHVQNAEDLYNATRGIWRINRQRAEKARFALAVYKSEIKEVYEIDKWIPASEATRRYWRERENAQGRYFPPEIHDGRSEFIGKLASDPIRKKYVGQRIPVPPSQNPIRYFNC